MTAIDFETGLLPASASDEVARHRIGPALEAVLAKHDDRLLADVGLARDELLGLDGVWRRERRALAQIWTL